MANLILKEKNLLITVYSSTIDNSQFEEYQKDPEKVKNELCKKLEIDNQYYICEINWK